MFGAMLGLANFGMVLLLNSRMPLLDALRRGVAKASGKTFLEYAPRASQAARKGQASRPLARDLGDAISKQLVDDFENRVGCQRFPETLI